MKTVEEILGKVFNIAPGTITDETGPHNTDSWDSFNGLILATELERNFNLKFTIEELAEVKKVGDIKKILKKHGIRLP